jgi:hypothetical protein
MKFSVVKAGLLAAAVWMPIAALAHGAESAPVPVAAPVAKPSVQATTAAVQATPPADLRVTYYTRSMGSDGVLREATYTNRVYRRATPQGGWVWTERELSEALRRSEVHGQGPHAGHAHEEAGGAPLRVSRGNDGKETVEVIMDRLRRVIEVERAHHGNVGYGGSWDAQYWLVPPATLRAMQPVGAVKNGVQRLRQVAGEQTTEVDWDVRGQYPRLIERRDAHGMALTRVKAERIATPGPAPWAASEKFDRGDYSDLLD